MDKPPLPEFKTDDEAEAFVQTANLADFDLSGAVPTSYEFVVPPPPSED